MKISHLIALLAVCLIVSSPASVSAQSWEKVVEAAKKEGKAGVRNFDIHIGGTNSIINGLLDEGVLEPVEPNFILPEVKDPKNWWGGHMWVDRAKKYVYNFQAYLTESTWRNETLA